MKKAQLVDLAHIEFLPTGNENQGRRISVSWNSKFPLAIENQSNKQAGSFQCFPPYTEQGLAAGFQPQADPEDTLNQRPNSRKQTNEPTNKPKPNKKSCQDLHPPTLKSMKQKIKGTKIGLLVFWANHTDQPIESNVLHPCMEFFKDILGKLLRGTHFNDRKHQTKACRNITASGVYPFPLSPKPGLEETYVPTTAYLDEGLHAYEGSVFSTFLKNSHWVYLWLDVLVDLPLITVVPVRLSRSVLTPGLPNSLLLSCTQLSSISPFSLSHITLKFFLPTIDFYFIFPGDIHSTLEETHFFLTQGSWTL